MTVVRALLGVGYYRSQNAPDLALYLGSQCYAGLTSIWCRLGLGLSNRPYIDHCEFEFDDSFTVSITPSIKGKDSTREAHIAEGEHALHTLTDDDRQAVIAYLTGWQMDSAQIACVLGISVKTVQGWRRKADVATAHLPTGDVEVDAIVTQAMTLSLEQRMLLVKRIQGR